MSPEWIAMAALVVALVAGVSGAWVRITSRLNQMADRLSNLLESAAQYTLKIDTLWDIYGVEAIREARMGQYTERESRERPSAKWNAPPELVARIDDAIEVRAAEGMAPMDIGFQVWGMLGKELIQLAEENDHGPRVSLGVLMAMATEAVSRQL